MSAHNHDEEIIKQRFGNTKTGKRLQKKADAAFDEKLRLAIMKANISGLSRDAARQKLKDTLDSIFDT